MTNKLTRLELTWPGKEDRFNPEPRILLEDKEKSFSYEADTDSFAKDLFKRMDVENTVEPTYDNMLIHGDNLLALKALEQDYTGKIKCIYIDPPYNTGNAFEHYDDGLEHSIWLSLMRDRLEILKNLLANDGMIFVQIDDTEQAYLKIIMDEIFGRSNYINTISVNTKVSAGASGGGEDKKLKKNIEFILLYAKNFSEMKQMKTIYKQTELMSYIKQMKDDNKSFKYTSILYKKDNIQYYKTIKDGANEDIDIYKVGNYEIKSVKQVAQIENLTEEQVYNKYYEQIMTTTNAQTSIRTRVWDATDNDNNMYIASYVPRTGKNKNNKIDLIFMGKQKVLVIWLKDTCDKIKNNLYKKEKIGTYWDGFSWINVTKEGSVLFPNGKKPESLIERVLTLSTEKGDLVLDSFLGSGTTAAVAHKMGRRWIGVEMGDHVYTHCLPRLQKVIKGEDAGGVTKTTGWTCGGGFKFYELASSLIVKDKYGQQIISDKYNADMLAEAMCKVLGYHYKPDAEKYWKQGYSSEKSFIYTTTMAMQETSLEKIASEIGDNNLLICCSAFIGNKTAYPNITVKKIPAAILKKCEWGREGYPLNLKNYTPTDKDFEFEEE